MFLLEMRSESLFEQSSIYQKGRMRYAPTDFCILVGVRYRAPTRNK
jgi:hypothetical protein